MDILVIKAIIADVSKKYEVNPNYIYAIVEQESNWNTYAVRYEPMWGYLFKTKSVSDLDNTEIQTQKMSWGLGQVMGSVAREQGLVGFLSQLTQPELNIEHMCLLITSLRKHSSDPSDIFAMYNGGPAARLKDSNSRYHNQNYVDKVTANLKKYEL